MTMFYVPTLTQGICVLSEEESMHAVKVLRLKSSDAIVVVDGVGGMYKAIITIAHHKHCAFEITQVMPTIVMPYNLHIAIAPTKNIDRFEWFVEKATEIGVSQITPIICQHSERKILKEDRVQKIIVAASKQSIKAHFPVLHPLCTFEQFVLNNAATQKFIAHCYEYDKKELKSELRAASSSIIMIGPEGDFSPSEINTAIQNSYVPVALGTSRLRTETAGLYACAAAALANI